MRRTGWKNKLTQFSYDHPKINTQLSKARISAKELSHMLDELPPKHKDKHEEHEEKRK